MAQQSANGNYSTSEVVAGIPPGTDEDDVSGTYGDGILTVSVGILASPACRKAHSRRIRDLIAESKVNLT